ncbi:MAG: rhomboid family intramembrane serine protease [Candidatus Rokubacteria bacterium]|nr:rhomboid family intramembrane serine protease [Candidatus Rokubacteria bacterium]
METAIRATPRASEAEEWVLVLAAAGVSYRLEPAGTGWVLLVPDSEVQRAQAALEAYQDEEARGEPTAALPERASRRVAWGVGLAAGGLLLAFFAVTGPPAPGSGWFERGAASAGRILGGEPWRAVTALTLHVDAIHVAGNAVATALLLPAIVRRLGPGAGVWVMLLAGTLGNLLGAVAHDPRHVAVGASTATFGALGVLAALRLWPASAAARTRGKPWMVVVASLVLLAMLGAGRGADVLAHGLGLLSGGAVGLAAGAALRRPPGPSIQWTLVALAALAVAGCWGLALAGLLT